VLRLSFTKSMYSNIVHQIVDIVILDRIIALELSIILYPMGLQTEMHSQLAAFQRKIALLLQQQAFQS